MLNTQHSEAQHGTRQWSPTTQHDLQR